MVMHQKDYLYHRYMYMEYGRDILNSFIADKDKFNLPTIKELSKEYVDMIKLFLQEINKDAPDEGKLKKHIATLGKQHYKMYLKLNN